MCICCCLTRKSLLIYAIIISSIAFIYGIVAISQFGSKTDENKSIKLILDYCSSSGNSYRRIENINPSLLSSWNMKSNNEKRKLELCDGSYGILKNLKGIENGLGTILFIFPIIFLVAEIIYLIFTCGISENQVLSPKRFYVLNIFKTITYTFAIIFIFLAIAYGGLLFIALLQYYSFFPDDFTSYGKCGDGIAYGMIFGYYSFWFYITLSCILGRERALFIEVGSQDNPGARAAFDINGNMIARAVVTQQVIGVPQIMIQPMGVAYQQIPGVNTNQLSQQNTPTYGPSQAQIVTSEKQQQMQNQIPSSGRSIRNEVVKTNNQ